MEPAKIDWKKLEWNFVEDELYEHINAPKWFDFLSPHQNVDDEAWFCRPDCKHPKTAEDFLRSTTPNSKAFSPAYVSENLPLGDKNRRDVKMKRRMPAISSASPPDCEFKFNLDSENQDPNLFTTPINKFKSMKSTIKSSEEKKTPIDDPFQDNKVPSLRSTLSAKNLFPGRPILNQITEFCNELKRLATRARERENAENLSTIESEEVVEKTPSPAQALEESDRREKERKPLLEVGKTERPEGICVKGKQQRKKRPEEAENIMPISLDLQNLRHKREENLQLIRTNPPSPQCFSATRGPNKITPSKASKASTPSRLMERGFLEDNEQNKETRKVSPADNNRSISIVDGRETKALDPCFGSSNLAHYRGEFINLGEVITIHSFICFLY